MRVREDRGIVVFGDVTDSRRVSVRSSRWLRALCADLDAVYGDERLARFGFTQGDELQGLLRPGADPFAAIIRAALDPHGLAMRWSVAAGRIDPGRGPTTQRTGAAFLAAREALGLAKAQRDGLVIVSGDPTTDAVLVDVAPLLAVLLAELTTRQREIARLLLVEGLRQAEAADRLRVARPTVSVAAERARVREIARLARALHVLLSEGMGRAAAAASTAGAA